MAQKTSATNTESADYDYLWGEATDNIRNRFENKIATLEISNNGRKPTVFLSAVTSEQQTQGRPGWSGEKLDQLSKHLKNCGLEVFNPIKLRDKTNSDQDVFSILRQQINAADFFIPLIGDDIGGSVNILSLPSDTRSIRIQNLQGRSRSFIAKTVTQWELTTALHRNTITAKPLVLGFRKARSLSKDYTNPLQKTLWDFSTDLNGVQTASTEDFIKTEDRESWATCILRSILNELESSERNRDLNLNSELRHTWRAFHSAQPFLKNRRVLLLSDVEIESSQRMATERFLLAHGYEVINQKSTPSHRNHLSQMPVESELSTIRSELQALNQELESLGMIREFYRNRILLIEKAEQKIKESATEKSPFKDDLEDFFLPVNLKLYKKSEATLQHIIDKNPVSLDWKNYETFLVHQHLQDRAYAFFELQSCLPEKTTFEVQDDSMQVIEHFASFIEGELSKESYSNLIRSWTVEYSEILEADKPLERTLKEYFESIAAIENFSRKKSFENIPVTVFESANERLLKLHDAADEAKESYYTNVFMNVSSKIQELESSSNEKDEIAIAGIKSDLLQEAKEAKGARDRATLETWKKTLVLNKKIVEIGRKRKELYLKKWNSVDFVLSMRATALDIQRIKMTESEALTLSENLHSKMWAKGGHHPIWLEFIPNSLADINAFSAASETRFFRADQFDDAVIELLLNHQRKQTQQEESHGNPLRPFPLSIGFTSLALASVLWISASSQGVNLLKENTLLTLISLLFLSGIFFSTKSLPRTRG